MTTAIQPAAATRTRGHRRGRGTPAYRPANATRTSIRTFEPAPVAEPTQVAPAASAATPMSCEQCARTRRFEVAIGRTVRRFLVAVALAAVAALTGGHPAAPATSAAAHSAPPAETPTATTAPTPPAASPVLSSRASGCAVPFALVGPCSPFGR
jgi:hypothetical protein